MTKLILKLKKNTCIPTYSYIHVPACAHTHTHNSKSAKIAALEAKLRQMEESDLSSSAKRPRLSSPPITHRHTVVTGANKRTRPVF